LNSDAGIIPTNSIMHSKQKDGHDSERPKMEMERRGWIIWSYWLVNQGWEEPGGKVKPLSSTDGEMIRAG